MVAVFNGARKRHYKRVEFEEFSDYCIGVDSSLSLDIPEYFVNTKNYSATLAHKVRNELNELIIKVSVQFRNVIYKAINCLIIEFAA